PRRRVSSSSWSPISRVGRSTPGSSCLLRPRHEPYLPVPFRDVEEDFGIAEVFFQLLALLRQLLDEPVETQAGDLLAPGPPGFDIAFEKVALRLPSRGRGVPVPPFYGGRRPGVCTAGGPFRFPDPRVLP